MTLRSIVQLRVANALTTKPPSLSSLGLDLSFDIHIDDLLRFYENVNKSRRLFTSIKHKQIINSNKKG